MTKPRPPDLIEALAEALAARFGLVPRQDVTALRDPKAGFVIGCPIRIGEYYDINPAMTIYDAALGTLGLVEQISRSEPEASLLKTIERGAAVRQILIDAAEEKSRNGPRKLPLQVELVLVISGAGGGSAPDSLRSALTRIARETGFLRLAGLSILDAGLHPELRDEDLRRAFAWLPRTPGSGSWAMCSSQPCPIPSLPGETIANRCVCA